MLLERIFAHDRWATDALIGFCAGLDDEVLDGAPMTGGTWSIREVLVHLVQAQRYYADLLGTPGAGWKDEPPAWSSLATDAAASSRTLTGLAIAGDLPDEPIQQGDGFTFAPWIVATQAVHHATEHRRQVMTELRARGIKPPRLDVWAFGHAEGDLRTPEGRPLGG